MNIQLDNYCQLNPFYMECHPYFNAMPVESRLFLDINAINIGEDGNSINNTFRNLFVNDLSLILGISNSRIHIKDTLNKPPATLVNFIINMKILY